MTIAYTSAYTVMQADPGREELWLLEITAQRLTDNTEVTLYFSSAQYGTGPYDTPPSRAYKACITRGFEFSAAAESQSGPSYGLMPSRQAGSIVLGQRLGELDLGDTLQLGGVPLRDYAFAGRRAVVKHGGYSPALGRKLDYDEFATIFTGVADGQPTISTDSVTIKLRSKDALFQYPINTREYFGCRSAVLFPASGGQVALSSGSVFDFTTSDFSWEFLYYFHANPGSTMPVITRGNTGTDGYRVQQLTTGAITFTTHNGSGTQTTTSNPLTPQVWSRISIVRDGASVRIWVDGVDQTATAGAHVDPVTCSDQLFFGRNTSGSVLLLSSMITDVRCWSATLTDSDINSRMHRPLDSTEYAATNLVGYWPCNEVAGTALDQKVVATGAGYDGVLSAGAVLVPSLLGGEDMQGNLLPHAWGYFDGFHPVLVDEATQIYQAHSGSIEAFDRVDIGGTQASSLGASSPYSNLILFLSTPTDDGEHDTCITAGGSYVRFGNLPSHQVTVAGRGDNTGGTFRYTCADLVRFIVCNMGWYPLTDPGELDTASFTALNTANSAQLGYVYTDEHSIADVVDFLLESVGAVGFFRRATDLFAVQQFGAIAGAATPTRTITEDDISIDGVDSLEVGTPTFRVDTRYKQNYTPMSTADILEGAIGTDREKFLRKDWRVASIKSVTVKSNFPDATVFIYDTAFFRWFDAWTECSRQLGLLSTQSQGFRFLVKQGKYDFDRMDTVYFDFGDYDDNGVRQNRFGSGPTRKFIVLDVADDVDTSGAMLTIWRDDA